MAVGVLHIVMAYCEGGDLCTRLRAYRGQLLPEPQVVEWFVQIALALQYLHERNILHRDLKVRCCTANNIHVLLLLLLLLVLAVTVGSFQTVNKHLLLPTDPKHFPQ